MVLKVFANLWRIHLHRDAVLAQQRRRANTGQLQQLGRLQGAAGQYHLAIGPGFVHRAVMADFPDLSAHQVYACGVPIMVDSAKRDFVGKCGLPEDAFYADSFTTAADKA